MNRAEKILFRTGLLLPHRFRFLKIPVAYFRYFLQRVMVSGKKGRPVIIVAMPKSGSTWLENIFMSLKNTYSIMPPACILYEQIHGNSHQQTFERRILKWAKNKSVVIKLHSSYSTEFFREILDLNAIFILLHRDIKEVSNSHVSYVTKTPFHPHFKRAKINEEDVKHKFETEMEEWISSWKSVVPDELIVNYQEMLERPKETLSRVLNYYDEEGDIDAALAFNSLVKMRDRSPHKSFFRGSKILKS
jgi:hypothetical protein